MQQLDLLEHVEVQVSRHPIGRETDNELAAMRPSPRRSPDLVARRASLLELQPHRTPAEPYPLWPVLIIVGVAVAYLVYGLVIR